MRDNLNLVVKKSSMQLQAWKLLKKYIKKSVRLDHK